MAALASKAWRLTDQLAEQVKKGANVPPPQVFLVALQSERIIEPRLGNLLTINAVFEDVVADLLHYEGVVADYVVECDVHRGVSVRQPAHRLAVTGTPLASMTLDARVVHQGVGVSRARSRAAAQP